MTSLDQWGSHIVTGKRYSVLHARGPVFSPTWHRQILANTHRAICYVEAHLNAVNSPSTNYATAVVAEGASAVTRSWALDFVRLVGGSFGIPAAQLIVGGRGAGNIARVKAPAFLAEPGFVSNPAFVARIRTGEGLDALGRCLAQSIRDAFPEGGIVALSVGHMYRGTGDKGANVNESLVDHDPAFDQEAELAEAYLMSAAEHLLGMQ